MAEEEAKLPAAGVPTSSPSSHRIICTSRVAKSFPETGFNVVCDKPMTLDLGEALELKKSGKVFALTYNYTGYPMVKEAREIVRRGELGKILKVVTEYPQGWLVEPTRGQGPGASMA